MLNIFSFWQLNAEVEKANGESKRGRERERDERGIHDKNSEHKYRLSAPWMKPVNERDFLDRIHINNGHTEMVAKITNCRHICIPNPAIKLNETVFKLETFIPFHFSLHN